MPASARKTDDDDAYHADASSGLTHHHHHYDNNNHPTKSRVSESGSLKASDSASRAPASGSTRRLIICALGIFICYFYYGIIQEKMYEHLPISLLPSLPSLHCLLANYPQSRTLQYPLCFVI